MNQTYEIHKKKLMELKKIIDNETKNNGISSKLLEFEKDLENNYKGAIENTTKDGDKAFISFNYFAPKTYILLAKSDKFEAIISFCKALQYFIQYINSLTNPDSNKWDSAYGYYRSISLHIVNSDIELFENTKSEIILEILNSIKTTLYTFSHFLNFKIKIDILLSDFLFSIVTKSSEIYTPEHLKIVDSIEKTFSYFLHNNDYISGNLKSIEFVLKRKVLYFYLRKLVPKAKENNIVNKNNIDEQIKIIIEDMKRISEEEYRLFKNVNDNNMKKFLAEIDRLSSEYYGSLWIKKDLINALKKLENIFSTIRNKWQKITTPYIFSHFVQEFVLLSNYFKLLLIARDFRKFGESLAKQEWQKEVSIKVGELLNEIASQFFKYGIPTSLERKLLIVEGASSGRFVEFIVFYLLREIIINKIEIKNIIKNISNPDIRDFLLILQDIKDISQIKWNHQIPRENSDIDILISEKYGIFLKTGILNSNDREKIFNEIELSEKMNLERVYQIIDIAKNLDTARKLLKHPNVTLFDVGEFLTVLLEIAYSNKKISLKINKSSILSWAGFYSGG